MYRSIDGPDGGLVTTRRRLAQCPETGSRGQREAMVNPGLRESQLCRQQVPAAAAVDPVDPASVIDPVDLGDAQQWETVLDPEMVRRDVSSIARSTGLPLGVTESVAGSVTESVAGCVIRSPHPVVQTRQPFRSSCLLLLVWEDPAHMWLDQAASVTCMARPPPVVQILSPNLLCGVLHGLQLKCPAPCTFFPQAPRSAACVFHTTGALWRIQSPCSRASTGTAASSGT